MTKNQASQVLDWLTSHGWQANMSAVPTADGTVLYALSALGEGDATKMRDLVSQVESRGLRMTITGFTIADPPPAPPVTP